MGGKELVGHTVKYEAVLKIFPGCIGEGSLLEHEYEEIHTDVKDLRFLRIILVAESDFGRPVVGSARYSSQVDPNGRRMPKID